MLIKGRVILKFSWNVTVQLEKETTDNNKLIIFDPFMSLN